MGARIRVEVVFALPERQKLVTVHVPDGSSVADAIAAAGLAEAFPEYDLAAATVGIWGQVADRDRRLAAGDRVELYRPLEIDPREARRQLAEAGRTMRRESPGEDQRSGSSS